MNQPSYPIKLFLACCIRQIYLINLNKICCCIRQIYLINLNKICCCIRQIYLINLNKICCCIRLIYLINLNKICCCIRQIYLINLNKICQNSKCRPFFNIWNQFPKLCFYIFYMSNDIDFTLSRYVRSNVWFSNIVGIYISVENF